MRSINFKYRIFYFIILFMTTLGITSFMYPTKELPKTMAKEFEPQDTFPVPRNIPNQLFYLQRTPNTNTVIYALNTKKDNSLDEDNPLKVFWVRYPEGGIHKDLSFIQRKFAYGISHKKNNDGTYTANMVAYKKRNLTLMKSLMDNAYHIYCLINKRDAILNRIFIRIDPGGSIFKPNVIYIELRGTDMQTKEVLIERIKP